MLDLRKGQCCAEKLAQTFIPDINVESGGVNSGITAAVSNVKSIYCGASGGVQRPECDYSSSVPNLSQEENEESLIIRIKLTGMLQLFAKSRASCQYFIPSLLKSFCLKSDNCSRTKKQSSFSN